MSDSEEEMHAAPKFDEPEIPDDFDNEPESNEKEDDDDTEVELENFEPTADDVDISPDNEKGIFKRIISNGTGADDERPATGDKVSVHYVGTFLDGTPFDSSRDRNELFTFDLGKGNVIKAWDIGVATMKRNEKAIFTCRPKFAYGKKGSPPKIPPYKTLVFEVELFDWKGEDITEDKDGGILLSKINKGEGYKTPKDGARCDVHLVGKFENKVFEEREVSFKLGEGRESGIVEGLEKGLEKMCKGGVSKIVLSPAYAFGNQEHKEFGLPANATVTYTVTLKDFEKLKETWEMDSAEKLAYAEERKNRGTELFKANKFHSAQKVYQKVIDSLQYEESNLKEETEKEKRRVLLLAAHLNIAMCALKLNNDADVVKHAEKALEFDAKSEKAYFRRGLARINAQDFDEAIADFKKVLEIDPANKAAREQIALAKQKIKQFHEKEKNIYGGMFQKFAAADAKRAKIEGHGDTKTETNVSKEHEDCSSCDEEGEKKMESSTSSTTEKPVES